MTAPFAPRIGVTKGEHRPVVAGDVIPIAGLGHPELHSFRPRAADDLPVLGRCREIEGLIYATGHYRNGILLAPITGEAITDLILSGVTPPFIETFSPDRFEQEKLRLDESRV